MQTDCILRGKMHIKNKILPYTMLLPAFGLICVFKLYPILSTLAEGFISKGKLTFSTYIALFHDPTFWGSIWVTVKFNIITIPLQIFIAFCMALLCNVNLRGIGIFRTIAYIPYAVSLTVGVMIWGLMFNYNSGIINSVLRVFGVAAQGFLVDKKQALWCIVVITSWKGCGYWMMFMLAGLKNIDPSVYEAATLDGAKPLQTIIRITLPLMKNVILFVCVANTSANMLLFAPMQLFTQGGPQYSTNVLMYEAYRSAFRYMDRGRSAAIVTVLLLIIVMLAVVQFRWLDEGDKKEGKVA